MMDVGSTVGEREAKKPNGKNQNPALAVSVSVGFFMPAVLKALSREAQ